MAWFYGTHTQMHSDGAIDHPRNPTNLIAQTSSRNGPHPEQVFVGGLGESRDFGQIDVPEEKQSANLESAVVG
jgi:hypothetical protein